MRVANIFVISLVFIFSMAFLSGCSKKSSDPTSSGSPDIPTTQKDYWQQIPIPAVVNSAAVDPGGSIWAGTTGGVYKFSPDSKSWTILSNTGLLGPNANATLMKSDPAGKIYAEIGTDLYIYNSTGNTWTSISRNLNTSLLGFKHMNTFNLDKTGNIYASMYISEKFDAQSIGMERNGLFKSTDGGQSWTEIKVAQIMGKVVNVSFDSFSNIFVIMDMNIFNSADGGKTWSKSASGLGSSNPFLLAANSNDVVYAATGNGLLRSSDKGMNWNSANWNTYCVSLGINSKDVIFIGGINKCFMSSNNAASWTEISSGLKHSENGFTDCVIQTFDKDGYAYAILESVLYKSSSSTTK